MVCVGFLRTQQRAKSQCIKHNPVRWLVVSGLPDEDIFGHGLSRAACVGRELSWLRFGGSLVSWDLGGLLWLTFNGEVDPGFRLTLAGRLTHAQRGERHFA